MKLWHGEPGHNHWRRPFTNSEKAKFWWSMSLVIALLAWLEWVKPSTPPFYGKLALLQSLAYASFGLYGTFYLFVTASLLMMYVGLHLWRSK